VRRLLFVRVPDRCTLVPAASAVSEYPMDAAGTRSLSVDGSIVAYRGQRSIGHGCGFARTELHGSRLHTKSETVAATDRSCAGVASPGRRASFAGVQVVASGRQAPDRLNVLVPQWRAPVMAAAGARQATQPPGGRRFRRVHARVVVGFGSHDCRRPCRVRRADCGRPSGPDGDRPRIPRRRLQGRTDRQSQS